MRALADLESKIDSLDKPARTELRDLDDALEDAAAPSGRVRVDAGEDERPEIRITERLDRMTASAVAALRGDPDTYQRAGALVHVARVDDDERRAGRAVGTPIVRELARASLAVTLSRLVRWMSRRVVGGEVTWKPARPDKDTTAAVHAAGEWHGVRVLVGVAEAPILRPDGSIVQTAGYDSATGYVYLPATTYPPIPDAPTQADAARALRDLVELFSDFPFASEAARYVPIAGILTLAARPAIDGSIPALVIEASTRGSGKTLLSDVIATVATGRPASRTTHPVEEDELRKVLDGYALQGAALVAIDNVARPLGGAALDACLTARDTVEVRELGRTGNRTVPWRALVVATGNNIQYAGDTIRRVLVARLEPNCERPEDRTEFRFTDLPAHVRAHRPRLAVAALTILRAYVVAGRPDVGTGTWGSFEAWARLIPAAIVHAGGANVLEARIASDTSHDPVAAALSVILVHIERLDVDGRGMTTRSLVDLLYPSGRAPDVRTHGPDGYGELRDAIEVIARPRAGLAPTARQIGEALTRVRGRWIDRRQLQGALDPKSKVARWRVEVMPV